MVFGSRRGPQDRSWRCGVRVQACPAASGADRGDQDNNEAEEEEEEEENKEKELHLC